MTNSYKVQINKGLSKDLDFGSTQFAQAEQSNSWETPPIFLNPLKIFFVHTKTEMMIYIY